MAKKCNCGAEEQIITVKRFLGHRIEGHDPTFSQAILLDVANVIAIVLEIVLLPLTIIYVLFNMTKNRKKYGYPKVTLPQKLVKFLTKH